MKSYLLFSLLVANSSLPTLSHVKATGIVVGIEHKTSANHIVLQTSSKDKIRFFVRSELESDLLFKTVTITATIKHFRKYQYYEAESITGYVAQVFSATDGNVSKQKMIMPVVVRAKVIKTTVLAKGKVCLLKLSKRRKSVQAVIFSSSIVLFKEKGIQPEKYYLGQSVAITGFISYYRGQAQIIIQSPQNIKIL